LSKKAKMAKDENRALLDALMGKDRNLMDDEKPRSLRWDDPEVCPYFLCGFCPNDLFVNTKSDLGPCAKEHDVKIRTEFETVSARSKYRVEGKFLRHLTTLVGEIDAKIARGNDRLKRKMEVDPNDPAEIEKQEKIGKLNENITTLLAQMETLGEEGKVDESQAMLKMVEEMKKEKADLESVKPIMSSPYITDPASTEKRMNVCETCGALLVVNDAENRVQAHLNGKQHTGYKLIRDTIAELEKKRADQDPSELKDSPKREKSRSRSRGRSGRDRDRRRRSRSRSRGRRSGSGRGSRRRSRSRSRDRGRRSRRSRSRSRDRGRRDRDRRRRSRRSRSRS